MSARAADYPIAAQPWRARATPYLVFLAFIYLLSYDVVPWKGGVLNYSDGAYLWPSGGFDFLSTWNASNLGFPFIAQSFTAFQYLPSLATELLFHGLPNGDAWHSYVLYYGPVYACCLITFFLAQRISGSALYGYLAGVFLILNNFMLEQLLVWPVSYFYCLVGMLLGLQVLWAIYEEGVTRRRVAIAIIASALVHHPFMFIVHEAFQVLFLAYICARGRARYREALAIVAGSVAIQAYWLIAFLYNLATTTVAQTHRASGDSAYWGYIYTITYRNLFNFLNYPLLLDQRIFDNAHHYGQTLFNYMVVALVAMMLIAAIRRGGSRMKDILFFLCVYLFFFNLALGPNSVPTGPLWAWAYINIPGFAFFRSFNRFNVVALIALLVLGALLIRGLQSRFKSHALALFIAANLAAYTIFLSGTFHGMVQAAYVPDAYYQANRALFRENRGAVILSLPHTPYESYRWSANERNDLTNPSMYFMSYFMNAPVIFNQYAYMLDRQYPAYKGVLDFYMDAKPFDEKDHEDVRRLGVTHVIVHKDRLDSLRKNDRIVPWGRLYESFAANRNYALKADNAYFAVFELRDPVPLVSGEHVDFRAVTQTQYRVRIDRLDKPTVLRLAQSYHPGWRLHGDASGDDGWGTPDRVRKNTLRWRDIPLFFTGSAVDESEHREIDGFANAWRLDPAELRKRLPPGSYRVNADGSLDVRMLIHFRPQSLFTLGVAISLLVSGLALLAALRRPKALAGAMVAAVLAVAVSGAPPASAAAAAMPVDAERSLAIYRATPPDPRLSGGRFETSDAERIARLRSGNYGRPEDYAITGRVGFKTTKAPMAIDTRAFAAAAASAALPPGWTDHEGVLTWRDPGGVRRAALAPLSVQGSEPLKMGDFDEFWLDYSGIAGVPPCVPQLELGFNMRPVGRGGDSVWSLVARTGSPPLRKLHETDPPRLTWMAKTVFYVGARMLGLAPDEDWRFAQAQPNVAVVQRRWRQPLEGVDFIDIAIQNSAAPVHVNLLVSTQDDRSAGELIEIALPPNSALPDGRPGVRLNVREILERRFPVEWLENLKRPGRHRFHLKETVLFLPGDASTFIRTKPVSHVAFLGADWEAFGDGAKASFLRSEPLASAVHEVSAGRQRLMADLRPIMAKGQVDLHHATVWLTPPPGATWCATRLRGAQATSLFERNVPSFASGLQSWVRRWGNVMGDGVSRYNQTSHPGILGYLPFASFSLAERWQNASSEYTLTPEKGQLLFRPVTKPPSVARFRVFGAAGGEIAPDENQLVSSTGATLTVRGAMPKSAVQKELLVVEGESKALTVSWPLASRLGENTWIYFGVEEGADQLGSVTLTLGTADGRTLRQRVEPNQPLRLATFPLEVRSAKLELVPGASPFRLKLRDLVFFSPAVVDYAQALAVETPTVLELAPQPVVAPSATAILKVEPGRVAGFPGTEGLRFTTTMDPPIRWFQGLQLRYRLPPEFANAEGCQLALRLEWSTGTTERRLCLGKASDSLFIPFANLLGSNDRTGDFGELRSIDWTLLTPDTYARGMDDSVELNLAVDGLAMVSAAENLRRSPLLYVDGIPIRADPARFKEALAGRYTGELSLPLPEGTLARMLAGSVRPANDWLFSLNEVVVVPRQPMPPERWRELVEATGPQGPRTMPRWLVGAGVLLLAAVALAFAWRKIGWLPRKAWSAGREVTAGAMKRAGTLWTRNAPRISPFMRFGHWVIGLAALGPGLLVAGRLGWTFPGVMLLIAAPIAAWAAYCHWHRLEWPGKAIAVPVRAAIWAFAIGCALWSIGRFGPSAEAAPGFLPLLAVMYARAPAIYPRVPAAAKRLRRELVLVLWLLVTAALYWRASVADFGSDRNHYYTVAAIAAVLALRAALLALQPFAARVSATLHDGIYRGSGTIYLASAIPMVVIALVLLALKLPNQAEQAAVVLYFCLLAGAVTEVFALLRRRSDP
jgi:hypothetical protein